MKKQFTELDSYTKNYLFGSDVPLLKDIVEIDLESYNYLEMIGLITAIGQSLFVQLLDAIYKASSIKKIISLTDVKDLAQSFICEKGNLIKKANRKNISKSLRTSVWNTYLDENAYTDSCFCCKVTKITRDNFQCGHVISVAHGGETNLGNLRPICNVCNSSMKTQNMFEFMSSCGYDDLHCSENKHETTDQSIMSSFMKTISSVISSPYANTHTIPSNPFVLHNPWLKEYKCDEIFEHVKDEWKIKEEYREWFTLTKIDHELRR